MSGRPSPFRSDVRTDRAVDTSIVAHAAQEMTHSNATIRAHENFMNRS
jgi:hypothetical protein